MFLAEIFGPDLIIVLVIVGVLVLFGGSKIPKFARSIGTAKGEFEKGMKESKAATDATTDAPKDSDTNA